ncbi:asparagine synthase (glutamine-hydrolyzing) [Neolewinella lacunae]|uniref:asparagine synthase (glutamine-hydrolyzing) n=1 Tax=Neolewinella lacunae TaxID=1517758 RepID=A0A923PSB3_9BACT|nr:asparagine synthase (glutamine-hydrolyzing) [Neolewinella lacunae]MBC6996573.1 asparagine synthase (glutamine-hydrolyzing) [Neolewinella lacunae]MDN3634863.1 asparagine synthase (glutamine-hydrolyzing) [Neolewinella lacunae]
MCGIYGTLQPSAPAAALAAAGSRAQALQAHRGPDQSGQLQGPGWLLAHRRLSIFDPSEGGRQPLQRDDLVLVFNGAIYNYLELRTELEKAGHTFQTNTDSEVILAAFQAWGSACFARFNGMWALAILDTRSRRITLSRDRFGIKPLYLRRGPGQLTFASEPRAIRESDGLGSATDPTLATEFLLHGWQDHRPQTLWQGIEQFPAATYRTYGLDHLTTLEEDVYYQLPTPGSLGLSLADFTATLRHHLVESVRLRTRSDVGYCLTLSGGIDSSGLAGIIHRETSDAPKTFSALFPGTPYDETPYVKAVLRHTGLENVGYQPTWEQFKADLAACQYHQDQPLASAGVVGHYGLIRSIQGSGQKVLLNGQGADEIAGGYDKFYLPLLRQQFHSAPLQALQNVSGYLRHHRWAGAKIRQRLGPAASLPTLHRPGEAAGAPPFQRSPDATVYATSVNLLREVGLPSLLRHEDRNTMAFGVESRVPYLDYRVVDLLLAAPPAYKIRAGVRKFGLRQALHLYLPPEVLNRHDKLGFATPQTEWMESHPDFFLGPIQTYCQLPGALLNTGAYNWCRGVLARRQRSHYGQVWRCWAWAVFLNHLPNF